MVNKEDFDNIEPRNGVYELPEIHANIGKVLCDIRDAIDNNTKVQQKILDNFKESRKDMIITDTTTERKVVRNNE